MEKKSNTGHKFLLSLFYFLGFIFFFQKKSVKVVLFSHQMSSLSAPNYITADICCPLLNLLHAFSNCLPSYTSLYLFVVLFVNGLATCKLEDRVPLLLQCQIYVDRQCPVIRDILQYNCGMYNDLLQPLIMVYSLWVST